MSDGSSPNYRRYGDEHGRPFSTLNENGPRAWYATQPTVTKLAEDRAEQLKRDPQKVATEIDARVRADLRKAGDFGRIHPLPRSGANVPEVALQTAIMSERAHRDSQSVELVWTGPELDATPFWRTEQAILQLRDSASQRITLGSCAVYRIPNIAQALIRAAMRGVRLKIIIETPDKIQGEGEYSTIRALGGNVAAC